MSLEDLFLQACKSGNLMLVMLTIQQKVDVNYMDGWGLRRAIRYNNYQVWKCLLAQESIQINLANEHGQSALHTASRFNNPEAISDLLEHSHILLNKKSELGSSPLMVAVKYCRKEAFEVLIKDKRVDLETIDNQQRTLEQVIGIAVNTYKDDDKRFLFECLNRKRNLKREEERLELSEEIQINEKWKEGNSSYNTDSTECINFKRSKAFFRHSISDSILVLDDGYFTE
eukprot:GFUD01039801.1.p1 GENE.GFUD01039801.1~~GFUD01039801.1.p1  ORF type:complete len:229 (+),score=55.36 GFUD01039801.1:129-815(+)